MKSKILNYVDFEKANTLLEGFNKSTGFVTAILDLDGNILSKSGWRQICTDFHRINPETALNCTISDTKLANKTRENKKYNFYKCVNGLIDIQIPIVIRGEHIANLYSGQFFFENPDVAFFKSQAKLYGFDERSYLEALEKVPVVSKEKVEVVMKYLLDIIQMIIEMTAEKLEQIELNEAIKKSEAALWDTQVKLQQNMDDLLESQRIAHLGTWRLDLATKQVVWSEELYRMYGFDPTMPLPSFSEHMKLFTPESWDKLSTSVEQTRTAGTPYELELEIVTSDGSNGWVWVRGEALKDSNGNITGLWGAAQDITERKKIEYKLKQSEEKFQLLFDKAPLGYLALDSEGCFIEVNQKWLDTFGYKKEEVIGNWLGDFLCPEYVYAFRERFQIFKAQGYIQSEVEMLKKDGRRIFIAFEGKIAYGSDGEFKQTHGIMQDITEQRKTEKALIESESKYRRITENMSDVVWTTDLNLNTTYVSPSAEKLFGESIQTYLTRSVEEKFVPASLREIHLVLAEELEKENDPASDKKRTRIIEAEHYRGDGSIIWVSMHVAILRDENGEVIGFQGVTRDITMRKKVERELLYLSNHDHLTGLYNRRFLEEELRRLDTKKTLPLSIIMCDVNGLKLVNDSFGHDSGDTLLKNAAEIIRKACREEDLIARIGGDEFVVVLPNTTANESVKVANHIKELASKEMVANIELSISYGYDTKMNDKQSIIETIANAENYMYRHKLYERSSIRSKTIDLIMNTLFEKSKREAAHSSRVSNICQAIASKMNFNKDEVNQMKIAGLIHDIGKIGVDEKILNKPGSLTMDERRDIERHPETGWRLLSSTNEFSELAQFVLNHHEKWDGSGYPNGLKGEAIQLEARIICVADAYDAMTSDRSYRKGLTREEAIKELTRCSGTQFDPNIVDILVNQILMA